MPVIVELRLRAERVTRTPYVPTTVQLHGVACALFEGAFSENHESQAKPFSIWPLTPATDGWLLRAAWLAAGFPQQVLASCGQLRVGPIFCTVTDLALHPESFTDLASGRPAEGVRLDFRSPTYFAQNGARIITPDPRLIVGSWRRHWNTHADPGLRIPEEDWRTLTQSLRLTEFDLSTQRRDTGYGRTRQGFTGIATLRLDETALAETRAQFTALSRYATFTGTGAQPTHGFGATTATLIPLRPDSRTDGSDTITMTHTAST
jgi:CRISPR-associated endoribonuclease Cas6